MHQRRPSFIKDYYRTHRAKKVLISYIVAPFAAHGLNSHTNFQECLAIADVFHTLGYSVDVINFDSRHALDYSGYSCIFGFGDPFCASFYQNVPGLVRIHYATGAHVHVQNTETLKRARNVYRKKGKWLLDSCRIVQKIWSEQTALSDAIIVLGNEWTLNTYAPYFENTLYTLPASYNAALPESMLSTKDFDNAKKHYLWFGSSGAVHKGLDLIFEVFLHNPDKTLHIAGLSDAEKNFVAYFCQELTQPNVIVHGFLDVASQDYTNVIRQCAFSLMPSCSEGCCTSLLNTMCNGLIPVFTPQCGIDVKNYALEIACLNKDAVADAVARCDALEVVAIRKMSAACLEDVRATCSCDAFKKNIDAILRKILA